MKKTFKVKNILKNKNKYNFKTELLLSALSLLVAFGTVSCKKDPVKPKQKTEEELKKEAIEKQKQLVDKQANMVRASIDSAKYIPERIDLFFNDQLKIELLNRKIKNPVFLDSVNAIETLVTIWLGYKEEDIVNKENLEKLLKNTKDYKLILAKYNELVAKSK